MDWIPLIGYLGLGALLKSMIDHFLSQRKQKHDRLYGEKRESYLGLLQALHDAAVHPCDKNTKAYGLWQARCRLFGSERVVKWAQAVADTNDNRQERIIADKELLDAMRDDLI